MRKVISVAVLLVLLLSSISVISAAESGFVPSVSLDDTIIVTIDREENREIIGSLRDEDGNDLSTVYRGDIIDTSVLEIRNGSTAIPKEDRDLLVKTYEELTADDVKLSEMIPILNEIAKNGLGGSSNADDLVVRDIYDFTVFSDVLNQYLAKEGNTVTLKLKLPTASDKFIYAVTLIDGVWQPVVNVVNNYDGTIDVTFSQFCPVLFVVGDKQTGPSTPATGDNSNPLLLAIIMLVSALCLICCLYIVTRSSNHRHHGRKRHKSRMNFAESSNSTVINTDAE